MTRFGMAWAARCVVGCLAAPGVAHADGSGEDYTRLVEVVSNIDSAPHDRIEALRALERSEPPPDAYEIVFLHLDAHDRGAVIAMCPGVSSDMESAFVGMPPSAQVAYGLLEEWNRLIFHARPRHETCAGVEPLFDQARTSSGRKSLLRAARLVRSEIRPRLWQVARGEIWNDTPHHRVEAVELLLIDGDQRDCAELIDIAWAQRDTPLEPGMTRELVNWYRNELPSDARLLHLGIRRCDAAENSGLHGQYFAANRLAGYLSRFHEEWAWAGSSGACTNNRKTPPLTSQRPPRALDSM